MKKYVLMQKYGVGFLFVLLVLITFNVKSITTTYDFVGICTVMVLGLCGSIVRICYVGYKWTRYHSFSQAFEDVVYSLFFILFKKPSHFRDGFPYS